MRMREALCGETSQSIHEQTVEPLDRTKVYMLVGRVDIRERGTHGDSVEAGELIQKEGREMKKDARHK